MNSPLTVIMPAYNEAEGIESAVQEVQQEILAAVPGSSVIVINDGSKDNTAEILERLAKADPRIKVINKANSGHGPSVVAGLNAADGEFVFLIDSDQQIPLTCFRDLWQYRDTFDAVFGMRQNRQDPPFRLFLSIVIRLVVQLVFCVKVIDTNIPCKLVRRQIWNELYAKIQDTGLLAPSIFLAIYAKKNGYKVIDVPVPHRARTSGVPSLKVVKLTRFCWNGFKQLLQYKGAIR